MALTAAGIYISYDIKAALSRTATLIGLNAQRQLQKRCTKVFEGLHKEFENDILKVLPREEPWWASASEQDLDNSPSATGEGQDWHFFFETLEFAQEPGLHEPGVDEYRALEQY